MTGAVSNGREFGRQRVRAVAGRPGQGTARFIRRAQIDHASVTEFRILERASR